MQDLLNLSRYPLDRPESADWVDLVQTCRAALSAEGLFNLPGLLRAEVLKGIVADLQPTLAQHGYIHARRHNIYFKRQIEGIDPNHAALTEFETSNRTICADQMGDNPVIRLYEWPPFAQFLAAVMQRPKLYVMGDPLARVNVMGYADGQALNWHFDRSEFTTTLLLQAPAEGGAFEYDRDLRSDTDPNFEGVADLLEGRRSPTHMALEPGTLNVFKGKNTAHRVTPVRGTTDRIIAVFSYYDTPNVSFSKEERIGFYGRAE